MEKLSNKTWEDRYCLLFKSSGTSISISHRGLAIYGYYIHWNELLILWNVLLIMIIMTLLETK